MTEMTDTTPVALFEKIGKDGQRETFVIDVQNPAGEELATALYELAYWRKRRKDGGSGPKFRGIEIE